MKSPITGGHTELIKEPRTFTFRGEPFEIVYHAYLCEDSGEHFTTGELDQLNLTQVHNKYRAKHRIPFPEEIRQIRTKYGVSATKMAEVLGFGINTYRNYEHGEIPQTSNARLINLAADPEEFEELVEMSGVFNEKKLSGLKKRIQVLKEEEQNSLDNYFRKLFPVNVFLPDNHNGFRAFNVEKFFNMISFFAGQQQPFKTRLNKLLFYADFLHYKTTGYSISGATYKAINLGPVPDYFDTLYERGAKEHFYQVEYILFEDKENIGEKFLPPANKDSDIGIFSESEMELLRKVSDHFKYRKTEEIIQLSHEEKAWLEHKESETYIPYDYAFEISDFI